MTRRSRAVLITLFCAGIALRVVSLVELEEDPLFHAPQLDALYHDHVARGLALSDWTLPEGTSDPEVRTTPYHRPMGYPLFLAALYRAFGAEPWVPRLAQHALGLLLGWLVWSLVRRLRTDDDVAALTAAGLCWLSPSLLFFETELQATSLTALWLAAYVLSLYRLKERLVVVDAVVTGLLLGLGALLRPNLAPLVVLLGWPLLLAWRSRGSTHALKLGLACVIVACLLASLVPLRNARAGGEPLWTSTNGAVSLLFANHERADGVDNIVPGATSLRGVDGISPLGFPAFKRAVERNLGRPLSYTELNVALLDEVWRYVRSEPTRFLALTGKRLLLLLGPVEVSNNREVAVLMKERRALVAAPAPFWLVLALALAGVGAILSRRRAKELEALFVVVLAAILYLAPLVIFFAGARFRAPLVPLLAVLGGVGLSSLMRISSSWQEERRLSAFVIVGLALGLSLLPTVRLAPDARPARHHVQRALAYQRLGQLERADVELEAARAAGAMDADVDVTGGYLDMERGRTEEAERAFRRALASERSVASLAGLGAALLQQGRAKEAVPPLEEALALDPQRSATLYNLGLARFGAGDLEGATATYEALLALDDAHGAARNNLARTWLARSRPERALPLLEEALRRDPTHREAAFNRARALELLGRRDEAASAYRLLLQARPDDVDALTNLGVLLERSAPGEALSLFSRAATLRPAHAGVQHNLVRLLLAHHRERDARAALEAALAAVPVADQLSLRDTLIRLLATANDDDVRDLSRAEAMAREVVEAAAGQHPRPLVTLILVLDAMGRTEESSRARATLEQLCAREPRFTSACAEP